MSDTMFSQIGDVAIFSYVFRRTHHDAMPAQVFTSTFPFADLEPRPVDAKVTNTGVPAHRVRLANDCLCRCNPIGVWTATPSLPTVTLTRESGKLLAQESNETEKTELLAMSDSTFVIQGDSDLITFEKGTDGKVTRMLFHDIGGSVQAYDRSKN